MDNINRSDDSEPGGSDTLAPPKPESRKFSPTVAALLRDAKFLIETVQTHKLVLPSKASIEVLHGETTLRMRILLADGVEAQEIEFSLNGSLLSHERPFVKNPEPFTTLDVQNGLDDKDQRARYLLSLCETIFAEIEKKVLNARPPETAGVHA